jgi:hypothetical protein
MPAPMTRAEKPVRLIRCATKRDALNRAYRWSLRHGESCYVMRLKSGYLAHPWPLPPGVVRLYAKVAAISEDAAQ